MVFRSTFIFFLFFFVLIGKTNAFVNNFSDVYQIYTQIAPKVPNAYSDPETVGPLVNEQIRQANQAIRFGGLEKARSILSQLKDNSENFTSYERSVIWNYFGYLNWLENNLEDAIKFYKKLLSEPGSPVTTRQSTTYTLATLSITIGNTEEGIEFLTEWMSKTSKVTPESYYLLAQGYFLLGDCSRSLTAAESALYLLGIKSNWRGNAFYEEVQAMIAACK